MIAWRLATSLSPPLTGGGARRRGGRWNSPGVPMVYASAHLSLAVLELLVHLESDDLPDNLVAYRLEVPDRLLEEQPDVPLEWLDDPLRRRSRRFGSTIDGARRSSSPPRSRRSSRIYSSTRSTPGSTRSASSTSTPSAFTFDSGSVPSTPGLHSGRSGRPTPAPVRWIGFRNIAHGGTLSSPGDRPWDRGIKTSS